MMWEIIKVSYTMGGQRFFMVTRERDLEIWISFSSGGSGKFMMMMMMRQRKVDARHIPFPARP